MKTKEKKNKCKEKIQYNKKEQQEYGKIINKIKNILKIKAQKRKENVNKIQRIIKKRTEQRKRKKKKRVVSIMCFAGSWRQCKLVR